MNVVQMCKDHDMAWWEHDSFQVWSPADEPACATCTGVKSQIRTTKALETF